MTGMATSFADQLLALVCSGTAIPGIAENASTSPFATLYVSLHFAPPDRDQSDNEMTYANYQRAPVARRASGPSDCGFFDNGEGQVGRANFPPNIGSVSETVSFWLSQAAQASFCFGARSRTLRATRCRTSQLRRGQGHHFRSIWPSLRTSRRALLRNPRHPLLGDGLRIELLF